MLILLKNKGLEAEFISQPLQIFIFNYCRQNLTDTQMLLLVQFFFRADS